MSVWVYVSECVCVCVFVMGVSVRCVCVCVWELMSLSSLCECMSLCTKIRGVSGCVDTK